MGLRPFSGECCVAPGPHLPWSLSLGRRHRAGITFQSGVSLSLRPSRSQSIRYSPPELISELRGHRPGLQGSTLGGPRGLVSSSLGQSQVGGGRELIPLFSGFS